MNKIYPEAHLNQPLFSSCFFENADYFISERTNFLQPGRECKIDNHQSKQIGSIVAHSSVWYKLLRLFLKQYLFPFTFTIIDHHQKKLVSIHREWFFLKSNITIADPVGDLVGFIQPKFKFPNCQFKIFNSEKRKIAEINGDWKGDDFTIIDKEHISIGSINKLSSEPSKETIKANRYHITLQEMGLTAATKPLIISTALALHLILNESQPPLSNAASK